MANENVKFKRGEKADLPLKGENGSVYVTTDTGEMYMDTQTTASDASNGESVSGRIKIKDTTKAPINHASTGTSYGVSSGSNYGHAKASTTTPKANGTASAGSETSSFARGDHVHPLQTSVANATKATQDSAGQQINTTYIKGLSVNGRTITYTKGDGTTGTITTQDSNTTYGVATSSTPGLVKSGGDITVDGTGIMSVANDSHTHSNSTITSLDASKLTGTINIDRLPKGSLERLVPVEDEDARFALTSNDVQLGDTVQQLDTGVMYLVVNESELDNESGYKEYTAGSATSVPWSGVTGKPSSFTPSSHTHTISQITNISSANVASAVKATQDSAGQDIDSTYIKGLSVSGRTITYTKGDGTTGTITTQDTNTTYSNATTSTAGLMSSSDKTKLDGIEPGANKYTHPSYTAKSSGLYKVTVDGTGHVSATSAVTKSDITALGIPGQDTNTTYSAFNGATSSAAGGSGLVPAPSAGASNRYLRSDGTWAVPPDTNTTYTLSSFGITASASELNYMDGVTSNVQTQLNGKAASSHTHSGTQITGLTADRALISNSSGQVAVSAVTSTELGYLDGVTSAIQTQLNGKAASSHTHNYAGSSSAGGSANSAVKLATARTINGTGFDGSSDINIQNNYFASLSEVDLNTQRSYGEYYGGGGNECTNTPSGVDWFYLRIFRTASGYTGQHLYSNGIWYSRYYDGSSWSSWSEIYSSTNKPTASEIGAAASSHTHNYAGSSSAGGAANSVANALTIQFNGTAQSTYNGSAARTYNITPSAIGAATSGHTHGTASTSAAGFLRQLNGSTSQYLRGDGTWATPPNTTYSNMGGASSSAAGKAGLVPAPSAGASNRYLRSDGTWAVPPDTNTTYTLSSFGITATASELNYMDGVTSNVQTQLNGKASSSHSHSAATTSAAGFMPALNSSTNRDNDATALVMLTNGNWVRMPDAYVTSSDTTEIRFSSATTEENGFMTASDKSKLDGIASGANKYTHPSYTSRSSGLYKITVDSTGHVSAVSSVTKADITALGIPGSDTNTTYSAFKGATTSAAGGSGLVPAPSTGAANRYLRSDGTWAVPPDTNTTYSGSGGISVSGTTISHSNSITAGNAGPTANSSPSFGGSFTVPYIAYDARGHITSRTNRTMTLPTPLTSLSSATSNTSVLGAKIVADEINRIDDNLSRLNKSPNMASGTYSLSQGITHLNDKNSSFNMQTASGVTSSSAFILAVFTAHFNSMSAGNQCQVGFANNNDTVLEYTRHQICAHASGDIFLQSVALIPGTVAIAHPYVYFTATGTKSVECYLYYKPLYFEA